MSSNDMNVNPKPAQNSGSSVKLDKKTDETSTTSRKTFEGRDVQFQPEVQNHIPHPDSKSRASHDTPLRDRQTALTEAKNKVQTDGRLSGGVSTNTKPTTQPKNTQSTTEPVWGGFPGRPDSSDNLDATSNKQNGDDTSTDATVTSEQNQDLPQSSNDTTTIDNDQNTNNGIDAPSGDAQTDTENNVINKDGEMTASLEPLATHAKDGEMVVESMDESGRTEAKSRKKKKFAVIATVMAGLATIATGIAIAVLCASPVGAAVAAVLIVVGLAITIIGLTSVLTAYINSKEPEMSPETSGLKADAFNAIKKADEKQKETDQDEIEIKNLLKRLQEGRDDISTKDEKNDNNGEIDLSNG